MSPGVSVSATLPASFGYKKSDASTALSVLSHKCMFCRLACAGPQALCWRRWAGVGRVTDALEPWNHDAELGLVPSLSFQGLLYNGVQIVGL